MINVTELMSDDVKTLPMAALLADIYQLMRRHNIRHVPIVDEAGVLLGIVSYLDVMAATPSRFELERQHQKSYIETTAGDIMKSAVERVGPEASARQAALIMESHKIGCLPVVEGDKLKGIITDSDFLNVAINLMEQIDEAELADAGEATDFYE